MIVFCEEDVSAGAEFGGNWRAVAVGGEFGVIGGDHLARGGFLRSAREIEGRAVLRADIIALAHALGRVMALKEQFHEVREGDFGGVEDDLDDLGMAGAAGADFFVGRVRGDAAGIADTGQPDALGLPEDPLGAPEAAEAENGRLVSGRGVGLDRAAVDEMGRGGRDRPGAAGQGGVTGRQGSGLAGEEHRRDSLVSPADMGTNGQSGNHKLARDPVIRYLLALRRLRRTERWPSGRWRTPGKCVDVNASPGFESLSLRHSQIQSFRFQTATASAAFAAASPKALRSALPSTGSVVWTRTIRWVTPSGPLIARPRSTT